MAPYVKEYAQDTVKKLATKSADNALAGLYGRIVPEATLSKANEAFVIRFDKELDSSMDLPTLQTEPYEKALKIFLRNDSVQDAILAPLDGESELDWRVLRGIWNEPPQFERRGSPRAGRNVYSSERTGL